MPVYYEKSYFLRILKTATTSITDNDAITISHVPVSLVYKFTLLHCPDKKSVFLYCLDEKGDCL